MGGSYFETIALVRAFLEEAEIYIGIEPSFDQNAKVVYSAVVKHQDVGLRWFRPGFKNSAEALEVAVLRAVRYYTEINKLK